jgi:hypothetical protein
LKPYVEKEGNDVVHDKDFVKDLEKVIGSNNKLLFIDNNFNISIVNESAGVWRDGCWLSNEYSIHSYTSPRFYSSLPTDGTAGKNNDYYSHYYDNYGNYGYAYGSLTEDEIYENIAEEIEDGFIFGNMFNFELNIDEMSIEYLTDEDYNKLLKIIADDVRHGIKSGNVPVLWELNIDEKDFNNYLIQDAPF